MADITGYPLFETYPSLRGRVQRVALGMFPTEVERLVHLEKKLGLKSLWVKRDDRSGNLCGGNKVRKLEFLLAGPAGNRKQKIIVYGPISSNWTLACTIYAHSLEIPVYLFLFKMKGTSARERVISLQTELAQKTKILSSPASLLPQLLLSFTGEALRGRVSLMPPGGTSRTSILGYVNAYLELLGQVDSGILPMPDVILLPFGTGGTAAGLAAGVVLSGTRCTIHGVRVASRAFSNGWVGKTLANAALRIIRAGWDQSPSMKVTGDVLRVENDFCGEGYGQPTAGGCEAAKIVEEEEGLRLDATYTAKAMSCLLKMAEQGWGRGKNVLFWYTLDSMLREGKPSFKNNGCNHRQ